MNSKSSLAEQLRDKEYRDAFVASQIRISLPMQCRALRESRDWTQPQLADAAKMSQPRISEMERPGERKPNIETLLRLASAFDVALQVRFVPFSKLVDDDDAINYDTFHVASFEEDIERLQREEERLQDTICISDWLREQATGKAQEKKPALRIEEELMSGSDWEANRKRPAMDASTGNANKGVTYNAA